MGGVIVPGAGMRTACPADAMGGGDCRPTWAGETQKKDVGAPTKLAKSLVLSTRVFANEQNPVGVRFWGPILDTDLTDLTRLHTRTATLSSRIYPTTGVNSLAVCMH